MAFSTQNSIDLRLIQRDKDSVMPVRQRPAAGDDLPVSVVANGLEFPDAANQLEVADMQIGFCQDVAGRIADQLKF